MPTVPGTQIIDGLGAGAGTVILLPDGSNIPWTSIARYFIDTGTSAATVKFLFGDLTTSVSYDFVTARQAALAMKALQSIPSNPSSFYILTQMFPNFAALQLSATTGASAGGESVVISGVGFQDGCMVNFGGVLAEVSSSDSNSVTITTPAGTADQIVYPIVVNPDGNRSTALDSFIYNP